VIEHDTDAEQITEPPVARTDRGVGIYARVDDVDRPRSPLGEAAVVDSVSRMLARVGEARAVAEDLTVRSEVHGDAVVVRLDGEIDLVTAPIVNKSIKAALEQFPPVLVVDLSGVVFMASAGLAELLTGHRLAGQRTAFRVVAPSRVTSRPLEMVGLTAVFGVFATLEDALASPASD